MAATKTNVFMDVSSCTFVYGATPTTKTIAEVTGASPSMKGTRKTFSGGAAIGPRVSKIVDRQRTVKVTGADLASALSVPQGVFGTLTIIINDVYNGATTGAITLVLVNCQLTETDLDQQHNDIGKFTMEFSAVWADTDPTTDPLTVTQAS